MNLNNKVKGVFCKSISVIIVWVHSLKSELFARVLDFGQIFANYKPTFFNCQTKFHQFYLKKEKQSWHSESQHSKTISMLKGLKVSSFKKILLYSEKPNLILKKMNVKIRQNWTIKFI